VDEAKLQQVLKRLAACRAAEFPYDRQRFAPAHAPDPEPLPEGLEEHRSVAIVLKVVTGLCVLAMPLGLIRGFIGIVGFWGTIIFGVWLAIHISQSPWHCEHRRRRAARNQALKDLQQIDKEWEQTVLHYQRSHAEVSASLHGLISDCRGLASQHQTEQRRA